MYLTELTLKNVRLFLDETISFRASSGSPRMWTALTGINGVCKTTVLQAIALAASGEKLARALTGRIAEVRRQGTDGDCVIEATFQRAPDSPPFRHSFGEISATRMRSRLVQSPGEHAFQGEGDAPNVDLIRDLRASGFLVLGFGVGRALPGRGEVASLPTDLEVDRVSGLFDRPSKMLSLEFYNALERRGLEVDFAKALRDVLVDRGKLTCLIPNLDWGPLVDEEHGLRRMKDLLERSELPFSFGGQRYDLEARALPHGYQSVLAWISELVGHAILDTGSPVDVKELRGIVLLDEIDEHLHPSWQRVLVPALRRALPRIQFVVTTHSPVVLPGFESEEIFDLRLEGDEVRAQQVALEPGLMSASEVLSGYFGEGRVGRKDLIDKEMRFLELKAIGSPTQEERAELRSLESELLPYWEDSSAVRERAVTPEADLD